MSDRTRRHLEAMAQDPPEALLALLEQGIRAALSARQNAHTRAFVKDARAFLDFLGRSRKPGGREP